MAMVTMKGGKGVIKDLPPWELAAGVWSDSLNFRSVNGVDVKVDGMTALSPDPTIAPDWMVIKGSSTTIGAESLILIGDGRAFSHSGSALTELTPPVDNVGISSMTRISGSVTEVTTSSAHSLTTADTISMTGCLPVEHDTVSSAVTVISTTVFRYTPGSATGAGVITPGVYDVLTSSNRNLWSTSATWTGGVMGTTVYANNNIVDISKGGLFIISSTSPKAGIDVTDAKVVRVFRDWLIQMRPYLTNGVATTRPKRMRWSSSADPLIFTASATNDAGEVDFVDTAGTLVDGMQYEDMFYVYLTDERYRVRWIGGNQVFDIERVYDGVGLLGTNCIANSDIGQVFITKDYDIRIHNGGKSKSIAEGRVKDYLRSVVDTSNSAKVFACTNPYTREVWICYPVSGSSGLCTRALMWNWVGDTWSIRSLPNVQCATPGVVPGGTGLADANRLIVGNSAFKVGYTDAGTTDFGATITATLERAGITLDDPDSVKLFDVSRIQADATAGNTASVQHGSAQTADATPTYASAVTHTQGTTNEIFEYPDAGRFLAWKMSTTATDWKQRSVDIGAKVQGRY